MTNYPFTVIIEITNSELGELVASITLANPFLFFLEVSLTNFLFFCLNCKQKISNFRDFFSINYLSIFVSLQVVEPPGSGSDAPEATNVVPLNPPSLRTLTISLSKEFSAVNTKPLPCVSFIAA